MILRDSNEMRDTIYLISKITMKQEINPLTGRFDLVNDKTGFHTVKVSQLPETWEEGVMYVVEYDGYTTTYVWSNWEYIETGSTAPVNQVQSDWEQTDDTQVDYIKNKPTDFGNTKTFYLANIYDLTTAQAIYDWYKSGKNAIIVFEDTEYFYDSKSEPVLYFRKTSYYPYTYNSDTSMWTSFVCIRHDWDTITDLYTANYNAWSFPRYLSTETNYQTPYTPQYPGSPATKKYVDDNMIAFKPFPSTFNTTWTTEQFLNSIATRNLPVGSAYLGQVSLSDMPDSVDIQWDVEVYVYPQNVIYAVMRSAEVEPYVWETNSYQYRGREPMQQQADWNQSDSTQVDYIKNKPTITAPTVISWDSWTTYTIKTSNSDPASGTANDIITFVL